MRAWFQERLKWVQAGSWKGLGVAFLNLGWLFAGTRKFEKIYDTLKKRDIWKNRGSPGILENLDIWQKRNKIPGYPAISENHDIWRKRDISEIRRYLEIPENHDIRKQISIRKFLGYRGFPEIHENQEKMDLYNTRGNQKF